MKILVLGGTGFLGSHLVRKLLSQNHDILILTRKPAYGQRSGAYKFIQWPIQNGEDLNEILNCEVAINLAGASIADAPWTKKRKQLILSSRVDTTRELADQLSASAQLKTFISASAVGFYGNRKTEVLTEQSPRGEGYLSDVCVAWEREANALSAKVGARVVNLRTGTVLDRHAGFLHKMEQLQKWHLGGPAGSGDAFVSWIHLHDWVQSVLFIIDHHEVTGPVNLVAPEPLSNRAFSRVLSEFLKRPPQLSAPEWAIRALLGELAALIFDSQNARPKKLLDANFKFQFRSLASALTNLYQENFTV